MTLDYSKVWSSLNQLESTSNKICSAREILDSAIEALQSDKKEKAETLMYTVDEYLQYYLQEFDDKFKTAWDETVRKMNKEDREFFDAVFKEKEYYEPSMPPWGHSDLEYLSNDLLTKNRASNFPGEQYTEEELNAMCDKAENDQIVFNKQNSSNEKYDQSWESFWNNSPVYDFGDYYPTAYENFNRYEYLKGSSNQDVIVFGDSNKNKVKKWVLPVQEIKNGDSTENEYFIELPNDLLNQVNWKENDSLNWEDNGDGTFTLKKVNCVVF